LPVGSGKADFETNEIIFKGKPYSITREKNAIDKFETYKPDDEKGSGVIIFDDEMGKYVKVPTFSNDLMTHARKKAGVETKGEFLEQLQKLYAQKQTWGSEPKNKETGDATGVLSWFQVEGKKGANRFLLKDKQRQKFSRLIEAMETDQGIERTKSTRGAKIAPTETQEAYDVWAKKLRDEEGKLTGELEFADPSVQEWIEGLIAKRQDKDPLTVVKDSPPKLWKFLLVSGLRAQELRDMSRDELIGKNAVSGVLQKYPRMYRVNTIIKHLTDGKFALFEKGLSDESKQKFDRPKWETPSKSSGVKFTNKDGKKIEWDAKTLKDKIDDTLQNENIGRTSWYPVAKAIRSFVLAGIGKVPAESPLAQTVNAWVGDYADVALSKEKIEDLKAELLKRNEDAHFFFLLALELGMRKTEAFTLNAEKPKGSKFSGIITPQAFPEYYEIRVMTWKTRWVGKDVNDELVAEEDLIDLIKKRKKQISEGKGISKEGTDLGIHALVGADNKYYPIQQLQKRTRTQGTDQRLAMEKLYDDIRESYIAIGVQNMPKGQYFLNHPFHAFRHIMAQYQLEMTNWDYSEVANMGHWQTLTILQNSYGEKPSDKRYGEKISRAKKKFDNAILKASEEDVETYVNTEEKRQYVKQITLNNKLEKFMKIDYARTHSDEFVQLVDDGVITVSGHKKAKELYDDIKAGNVLKVDEDDDPDIPKQKSGYDEDEDPDIPKPDDEETDEDDTE